MTRLFVRHAVKDYATWRQVYDRFDAVRTEMGAVGHRVFQSVEDPNDVTAWHDFKTPQAAKAFAVSEKLKAAMKEAGVIGAPLIWFVNEAK